MASTTFGDTMKGCFLRGGNCPPAQSGASVKDAVSLVTNYYCVARGGEGKELSVDNLTDDLELGKLHANFGESAL